MFITCCKLSRVEWVEEEYKFVKPPEMDKKTFEYKVCEMLDYDGAVDWKTEFAYTLNGFCYVTFRKRMV
jgi:hypothetical protein